MRLLLGVALLLLVATACNKPQARQLSTGYTYVVYTDKSGPTPQPGDEITYYYRVSRNSDQELQTNFGGEPDNIRMPRLTPGAPGGELPELMSLLSAGDSAALFMPVDSLPQLPPEFDAGDTIIYTVKIESVLDSMSVEDRLVAERREAAQPFLYEAPPAVRKPLIKGHTYAIHVDQPGPTPEVGDVVTFNIAILKENELLSSTFDQQDQQVEIPALDQLNAQTGSPEILFLNKLSVGDTATLYLQVDSLPAPPQGFEAGETMKFVAVISKIESAADIARAKEAMQARAETVNTIMQTRTRRYREGALADQLQTTASGLEYIIHERGTGALPRPGQRVKVQYSGHRISDGGRFDNSFKRGEPFTFQLGAGRVIRGWDEGVALLPVGSKATLFIPADLGYGATGAGADIPPNADLAFYIEVVDAD